MVNALKQAVQFGLDKKFHIAGAQQELEVLRRPAAGGADRHLGVRMVLEAAERAARRGVRRRHPQEERRPGADRAHLVRLRGDPGPARSRPHKAKSLDAVKMAKALQGFKLPPEVALMPNEPFFRAGENQLIPDLYVGHAQSKGADDPEDLFKVDEVVKGADVAASLEETGCKMTWPA